MTFYPRLPHRFNFGGFLSMNHCSGGKHSIQLSYGRTPVSITNPYASPEPPPVLPVPQSPIQGQVLQVLPQFAPTCNSVAGGVL